MWSNLSIFPHPRGVEHNPALDHKLLRNAAPWICRIYSANPLTTIGVMYDKFKQCYSYGAQFSLTENSLSPSINVYY